MFKRSMGILAVLAGVAAGGTTAKGQGCDGYCPCWVTQKTLFTWRCCQGQSDAGDDEDEPLVTDRPDFTEATDTVGLRRLQIEMGYTYVEDDDNGERFRGHSYPETLFRIGMLAEWFELRVAWNYLDEQTTPGGRDRGADDMYVGAKIALVEQCGVLPALTLIPQMNVPTGARAFTTDEVMPGMNFIYAWDVTDFISVAGSTQGNRVQDDAGHSYTEFAQSGTIGLALTERVGAYAEYFGFYPHSAQAADIGSEHYLNGGFTYLVNNDIQLDIRSGVGLNERADDFFTGAGASVRF